MTCNSCKYLTTVESAYAVYVPSGHWMLPPQVDIKTEYTCACAVKPGKPKAIPQDRIPCSKYSEVSANIGNSK